MNIRTFTSPLSKLLLTALAAFSMAATAQSIPSFPGAEGFGTTTPGGRGGRVIKVTSLNNSGPGTLREALEASGRRIIVFAVEGRIRLNSQITVSHPYVTLAGQTAPGEGVVVSGARIQVATHDVIIRGMKIRAGDDPNGDIPRNRDNLSLGNGAENVVIDSNSFTWSVDESLSIWGAVSKVAMTNNIVAESLNDSIHVDEGKTTAAPHSMGSIIGGKSGSKRDRITFARNLMVSNKFRNPFVKSANKIEIINNYVNNYGAAHQGMRIGGAGEYCDAIVRGNYYEDGFNTNRSETRPPFYISGPAQVYLDDNYIQYHSMDSYRGDSSAITNSRPFTESGMTVLNSRDVRAHVLANVGARKLGRLDVVDRRIVTEVQNGTARIIDSQNQKGGYSVYNFSNSTEADSDNDGMPNWFEDQYGYNRNSNDANLDKDQDGYTNIEEYINGMLTGSFDNNDSSDPVDQPQPEDPSPDSPEMDIARVEAENFQILSGFTPMTNSHASNNTWIQTNSSGSAQYVFQGASGIHRLVLGYFDETDGVSSMQVYLNGQMVTDFLWDKNLGSALANSQTATTRTLGDLELNPGDVIVLQGQSDGSEPLRTDYLDFQFLSAAPEQSTPKAAYQLEAEDLDLDSGYRVQSNGAASGGKMISTNSRGIASFVHSRGSGRYDLKITYFDENDGSSVMRVKKNGVTVDSWTWNEGTSSRLATKSTIRVRTVSIQISEGEKISFEGTKNGGEPARLDKLEMIPAN